MRPQRGRTFHLVRILLQILEAVGFMEKNPEGIKC
jgi:hypothetical protein